MQTLRIDILNPKATRLLKDLEDLNLISIQETPKTQLLDILKKIRGKFANTPSLEEITKEVEAVRKKRYAK